MIEFYTEDFAAAEYAATAFYDKETGRMVKVASVTVDDVTVPPKTNESF